MKRLTIVMILFLISTQATAYDSALYEKLKDHELVTPDALTNQEDYPFWNLDRYGNEPLETEPESSDELGDWTQRL